VKTEELLLIAMAGAAIYFATRPAPVAALPVPVAAPAASSSNAQLGGQIAGAIQLGEDVWNGIKGFFK